MILLSILLISALALSAACGGDDDDGGDGDSEATATQSSDNGDGGDDSGDDEETPEATDEGDDSGDEESDSLSDLEELASEYQGADGVVTYTFVSSDDSTTGTWTIYSEGDNSRIDFVDEGGTFISITTPEASYSCTESDGDGFCFEGEGGVGSNPFAGLFTSFASYEAIESYIDVFGGDIDVEDSSEEIAGVDAACFTASGDFDGDSGTVKWCFSDDGLLLLSSYQLDSGDFEMRATSFDSDVPDDAFEPPYEVTDFSDLGQ
jgi:hypothetical protein